MYPKARLSLLLELLRTVTEYDCLDAGPPKMLQEKTTMKLACSGSALEITLINTYILLNR